MSKRKTNDPARMFEDSWKYDYLFIEWKEKQLCLICGKNVSASKLFSVKKHNKTLHEANYAGFVGKLRADLVKILQCRQKNIYMKNLQKFFTYCSRQKHCVR